MKSQCLIKCCLVKMCEGVEVALCMFNLNGNVRGCLHTLTTSLHVCMFVFMCVCECLCVCVCVCVRMLLVYFA